jgi:putative FmdB family regulatory protein
MPLYHYKCSNGCGEYETYHSIKEPIRKTCEICHAETLEVVLDGAPVIINKEIKTIGQLAEANAKKMGRHKLEEKMAQDGVKQKMESQEKMKQARKIASLSPEQKTKYIETGKL